MFEQHGPQVKFTLPSDKLPRFQQNLHPQLIAKAIIVFKALACFSFIPDCFPSLIRSIVYQIQIYEYNI